MLFPILRGYRSPLFRLFSPPWVCVSAKTGVFTPGGLVYSPSWGGFRVINPPWVNPLRAPGSPRICGRGFPPPAVFPPGLSPRPSRSRPWAAPSPGDPLDWATPYHPLGFDPDPGLAPKFPRAFPGPIPAFGVPISPHSGLTPRIWNCPKGQSLPPRAVTDDPGFGLIDQIRRQPGTPTATFRLPDAFGHRGKPTVHPANRQGHPPRF